MVVVLTRTGPPVRRHDEARTRKCASTLPTVSVQGQNARGMPVSEYAQVSRREAGAEETAAANRSWWDAEAGEYYAEHGTFLGDADFVWGPEGWREDELGLLGDVEGHRVLAI